MKVENCRWLHICMYLIFWQLLRSLILSRICAEFDLCLSLALSYQSHIKLAMMLRHIVYPCPILAPTFSPMIISGESVSSSNFVGITYNGFTLSCLHANFMPIS